MSSDDYSSNTRQMTFVIVSPLKKNFIHNFRQLTKLPGVLFRAQALKMHVIFSDFISTRGPYLKEENNGKVCSLGKKEEK